MLIKQSLEVRIYCIKCNYYKLSIKRIVFKTYAGIRYHIKAVFNM